MTEPGELREPGREPGRADQFLVLTALRDGAAPRTLQIRRPLRVLGRPGNQPNLDPASSRVEFGIPLALRDATRRFALRIRSKRTRIHGVDLVESKILKSARYGFSDYRDSSLRFSWKESLRRKASGFLVRQTGGGGGPGRKVGPPFLLCSRRLHGCSLASRAHSIATPSISSVGVGPEPGAPQPRYTQAGCPRPSPVCFHSSFATSEPFSSVWPASSSRRRFSCCRRGSSRTPSTTSTRGVTRGKLALYAGAAAGDRARRRRLPLPDAPHPHRRLARHRIRPPQRVLRAASADAARPTTRRGAPAT